MSFRYTNSLIGALKHRLAVESAHREIVRRTFVGTCNGVEVRCSGYGTVLGIRLVDRATWEPFYTRDAAASPTADASDTAKHDSEGEVAKPSAAATTASPSGGFDLAKLSQSIKAATWEAIQLIRAAKEDAHARAVLHNPQSRANGRLRDWYELDATAMHPRRVDALKQEAATPWMQAVRFSKENAAAYLTATAATAATPVSVLEAADCDPLAIPVGATHPLHTPALAQLEAAGAGAMVTGQPNLSRVDERAVLCEQRKEMSRDEQLFWERVELIRRGQLASIRNGGSKRGYADMAAVTSDKIEEKVELKFTQ